MRAGALLCGVVTSLVVASAPSAAQGRHPPLLRALEGTWEGTGFLLGRPGAFTMRWDLGPNGFARLSFTNAWMEEDGSRTQVLAAEATYMVRGVDASGVWIDTRPRRLTLEASLTDTTLTTRWTAPTETGRTEYVVRSPDSVIVRDYVSADGGERLFAEATYRRGEEVALR